MTNEELLRKANEALLRANFDKQQARLNEDRKFIISQIGKDIVRLLEPLLGKISENSRLNRDDIYGAVSNAIKDTKLEVQTKEPIVNVSVPDVYVPQIKVPEIRYTPPTINIPKIEMPDEMNIKGWVQLMGVDLNNPLPVQLRDKDGKPVNLLENLTTIISGGGGGGKHDFFTIKGFNKSAFGDLMNADDRLKVSIETGATGLTDAELRASSVPVEQVSGSLWSVAVKEIFGSVGADVINPDGRIKVEMPAGAAGLTDAELRASSIPVEQVSGSMWSVNVAGALVSIGATILDGDGLMKSTWLVSDITASVKSALIDSSGVQYSGSNPVPITIVSGALTSVISVGPVVADAADDGNAPVQSGGIARTTNPTAVADGDVVKSSHDDLGRQLMRPLQVRDLIRTAYVAVSTGTETTLLASGAGKFLDLIEIMCANQSSVATYIEFRASTGGNVCKMIEVPANGTAGVSLSVPYPAPFADHTWTVDMPDITGTTVAITALFTEEI